MADVGAGAGQVGAGMDVDEAKSAVVALAEAPKADAVAVENGAAAASTPAKETTEAQEEAQMQPSWSMENVVVPTEAVAEASVQNATCMPALRDPVVANTDYYCLPANWVKGWQMFALGRSTAQPGMIDNTILIDRITKDMVLVKKELSPGQDYEIIPASVWNKFVKWYGYKGPEVKRIASEGTHRMASVILHPLTMPLTLFRYPNTVATATGAASVTQGEKKEYETFYGFASNKIGTVKAQIAKKLGVEDASTIRLWDFYSPHQLALLDDNKTLSEANIVENNAILVEYQHPIAKKFLFEGPRSLGVNTGYYSSSTSYSSQQPRQVSPGKQGLGNLGNTCFMNSGLQCLSACVPLTDFFLSSKYVKDINRDNPIGAKGLMAEAYGKLLGELWSSVQQPPSYGGGYYSYHYNYGVEPRQLKGVVERFAPQFAGYQQQDSQELLAFLLDGLHEDLNRILRKPYVEGVTGTPNDRDEDIANKAWDGHKKRNDSVIVDHFQGQLKSKVVCPHCSNVSITFDPFMYLSLPLPIDSSRWVKCVYVPIHGLPTRHAVALKATDSITTLFQILTSQINDLKKQSQNSGEISADSGKASKPRVLTPDNTVFCELNYGAFYERKKATDLIDSLEPRETYYLYEMEAQPAGAASSSSKGASDEPKPTKPSAGEGRVSSYPARDSDDDSSMPGLEPTRAKKDEDSDNDSDSEDDQKGAWAYLPTTVTYAESYGYSNYVTQTKAHMPFVISTPNHCTWKELYERICLHLAPYCRNPLPNYDVVMEQYNKSVQEHAQKVAEEKRLREAEEAAAAAAANAAAAAQNTDDVDSGDDTKESGSNVATEGGSAGGVSARTRDEESMQELDDVEKGGRGRSPSTSDEELERRRARLDSDSDEEYNRRYHSSAYRSAHHSYNAYSQNVYGFNRNPAYTGKGNTTSGAASAPPPSSVPPVAPPAFPFTISVTERYRNARALSPTSADKIRFGSADDITYSIAFPSKAVFLNYIDESLMKVLEEHPSVLANARAATGGGSSEAPLPLKDCLDLFCTEEQLTEENMWYCNRCRDHVRAIKKLELWSLPRILVIHLKRFHYGSRNRRDKISTLVQFPLDNLDLTPYLLGHLEGVYGADEANATSSNAAEISPESGQAAETSQSSESAPAPPQSKAEPLYDLFAVSNHYGGMGGGHYTAYARHRDENSWYYYDDSSCRPSNESDVQSTAAYVLFYHRKDVPWPKFDASIIGSAAQPSTGSTSGDNQPSASSNAAGYVAPRVTAGGTLVRPGGGDNFSDDDSSEDEHTVPSRPQQASRPRTVVIGGRVYATNDDSDEDVRARSSDDDDEDALEQGFKRQLSSDDDGDNEEDSLRNNGGTSSSGVATGAGSELDDLLPTAASHSTSSRMVVDEPDE